MIPRSMGRGITGNSKNYFISKYKSFEEKGYCYFKKDTIIQYWAEIKLFSKRNVGK